MDNNKEILYETLRDNPQACDFIVEAFHKSETDSNFVTFLRVIKEVIKAKGGIRILAREMGYATEYIESCLRRTKNLEVDMLNEIFDSYYLELKIIPDMYRTFIIIRK